MTYLVYPMEKGNYSSGGIGNHINRTEGKEHSYLQADPARKNLNIHFDIHEKRNELPLHQAIEKTNYWQQTINEEFSNSLCCCNGELRFRARNRKHRNHPRKRPRLLF